jgi:hypothetical protein
MDNNLLVKEFFMKKVFKVLAIIALVAVIGFSMACGGGEDNQTPVASDYYISNLNQFTGSVTAVIIIPKGGKSTGAVSNIKYAGNETIPQTEGTYAVTFDVAAAPGWDAATNLSAGNLVVITPFWTAVSDSKFGSDDIFAVAYGNDKFVAGGKGGKIAYSSNGATWTAVTAINIFGTGDYDGIRAIAYGNGKFVAGGTGGKMVTSTDGVTWTTVSNSTFTSYILAIAYGSNGSTVSKFVAGGINTGKMATSTDGTTWATVTNNTGTDPIEAIAYGNGKFVAVGWKGKMATSTDGTTWTAVSDSTFGSDDIEVIAYGKDKFVAGGSNGKMAYSSDGITWTAISDSTFGTSGIYAIAYGNGKFVAGGIGKTATSTDGVTWTATPDRTSCNAIAYGNNKFVAVGYNGKIAYSDN